ncbi:MAG: hypothetical protein WBG92_08390, partial [Thiohalocapsa sp.]
MAKLDEDEFVEEVIAKALCLKRSGFWKPEPLMRPRGWLSNFDSSDRFYAAHILDRLIFYSNEMVDALYFAAYSRLARQYMDDPSDPGAGRRRFDEFLQRAIFTGVEGERPNPTDSGKLFCRKARQRLAIPEGSFVDPVEALEYARQGRPVVFLDDFAGSGDQLAKTLSRNYSASEPKSFLQAAQRKDLSYIYICLIITYKAATRIQDAR